MNLLTKNMGTLDKIIRVVLALVLLALYFTDKLPSETLAAIIITVSAIFLITSILGICPLYFLLKITTRKRQINE